MDRTIEGTNLLFINNLWIVITRENDTGDGPWWDGASLTRPNQM